MSLVPTIMSKKYGQNPIPKGKRSSTSSVRSRPGQALIKAEMHAVKLGQDVIVSLPGSVISRNLSTTILLHNTPDSPNFLFETKWSQFIWVIAPETPEPEKN